MGYLKYHVVRPTELVLVVCRLLAIGYLVLLHGVDHVACLVKGVLRFVLIVQVLFLHHLHLAVPYLGGRDLFFISIFI